MDVELSCHREIANVAPSTYLSILKNCSEVLPQTDLNKRQTNRELFNENLHITSSSTELTVLTQSTLLYNALENVSFQKSYPDQGQKIKIWQG